MYRALAELHTRSIFARCCNFSLSRETGRQIHSTAKDRLSAEAIPDTGSNVSASDLYLSLSLSLVTERRHRQQRILDGYAVNYSRFLKGP